jgi:hypothetical protein
MSFYYWKTNFQISEAEAIFLKEKNVKQLFIKSFDVILGGTQNAVPTAILKFSDSLSVQKIKNLHIQIIPTIFIQNQIFKNQNPQLEEKILSLLENIFQNKILFQEIQIDCDWTQATKTAYFDFLKQLANRSNRKISATIRLHQVKFFQQTGVPPVHRGTLMAYNVGDMNGVKNSILNTSDLKSYFQNFDTYPLDLDVALPIYEWAIVLRDGETAQLLGGATSWQSVAENAPNLQQIAANLYEFKSDSYFQNQYFYAHDRLKIESVSSVQLLDAATLLSEKIKNRSLSLTFYHLDSVNLSRYEKDFFEHLATSFRR